MSTVIVVTADLQGDPADMIKAFRDAEKASREFADKSENDSKKTQGAWDGIKSGALKLAGVIAAAFSVKAIVDFTNEAITQAGNLQQSVGAVDAVFKDSSGVMHEWAMGAADAVGLSTDQYNTFASLIGTQMKTAGFSLEEATTKTNDLIGTAADLSSMFGGTTADAVSSLSAAFRGEFDSIEKYGLAIKEGDLTARLAAKGLKDLEGEAYRNARAQELLAMITEQSTDSQGNFAKEADTLQGQQQRLTAEFENQQAMLGTALLPAMTGLAQMARDVLPGAFGVLNTMVQSTIGFFEEVSAWFEENATLVSFLATVLGGAAIAYGIYFAVVNAGAAAMAVVGAATKVWTGIQWLLNAAMSANPIGLIITAIGALVGAIIWVATQTTFFQDAWAVVSQFFIDTWTNISSFFSEVWTNVVNVFTTAWQAIVDFFTPVIEFIAAIIRTYVEIWINIFLVFAAVLKTIWDAIATAATWVWEQIYGFVAPIVEAIASFIGDTMRNVQAGWEMVWGAVSSFFEGVWQGIVDFLTPIALWLYNEIMGRVNAIRSVWESVWGAISSFFSGIWDGMVGAVQGAVSWISDIIGTVHGVVMDVFSGIGDWLVDAGGDLIRGFWNGISDMWGWITTQIGGFFDGIVDWAKDTLGIASPSKVMIEVGHDTGEGVAVGLMQTKKMVMDASLALIPQTPDPKSLTAAWDQAAGSTYGMPPWMAGASAGQTQAPGNTEINIEIKLERSSDDDDDALVDRLVEKLKFALGGSVVPVP